MAVQLAVASGAKVIGTASQENHDRLRQLGAEPVTYGDGLLERIRSLSPSGVDAVIDVAGTDEAITASLALVADRDRVVTLVAYQKAQELGLKSLGSGPGADPGTQTRAAARLRLVDLAGEGKLQVFVAATYPLSEAAAAHTALASGRAHGKVVLLP
jgi:NADPH:quinone reductase-like Zn-dependent oxidoreductase